MDFVVSIVTAVGQYAVAPLGRQFGYLIFYKGNLSSLQNQSEELKVKRAALQQIVNARKNAEDILSHVELWLTKAEEYNQLAQTLQHENEAKKWCLRWCPNLKFRYSLGKKAKKLAEEMQKLHERGNFPIVSTPKPPPPIEVIFEKGTRSFVSRATVMENIMQALKDDKIHMIGICGMGGVGKTTMAHEVIKRANEWKLFDEVVMVSVSKTPNVWKIQADIAFFLNLQMPPNAETTEARACWLLDKIKEKKKILVVLDDIWNGLKLNEIGIPFNEDHKGCKILLTSRNEHAVEDTGADRGNVFAVGVLNEEEAWSLFKEKAGIFEDSIQPANLLSTQRAVAKECEGLPLALVTVGSALKGKNQDAWAYALRQLQQHIVKNIRDVEEKVHRSLKYSYDQLSQEEAKRCFLLCSVYPEDYEIPVEDLVRYGYAMKLFAGAEKICEARGAAYFMVDILKKCYLLSDGGDEEHVKMHDIIRDVAISIASNQEHPFIYDDKALKDLCEEEHKRYDVISLQHLGEYMLISNLKFPKLRVFRLNGDGTSLEMPNNFYQGMGSLKVVALSNISFPSLPTSLGSLSSLHTLSIENCEVNGNMSIIGELKNLEILSFKDSVVEELPVEMENLTRLRLLDLYECEIEMIASGILSSLSSLEEIYIGWVSNGLLECISELSSLPHVMVLSITLEDHNLWPRNWSLAKMKNFDINLGYDDFTRERYKLKNRLRLTDIDVSAVKESGLRNILKSSKVLGLCSIRGLKDIFYDLGVDNFENLTSLRLESCETIEHLINATHGDPQRAFPVMEKLKLIDLERLRMIRPTRPQAGSSNATTSSFSNTEVVFATLKNLELARLPELIGKPLWKYEYDHHQKQLEGSGPIKIDWLSNLTNLSLTSCGKLESLFTAPVARRLVQLQEIYIDGCELLEAIVIPSEGGDIHNVEKGTIGEEEEEEKEEEEEEEIMFPELQELYLWDLQCFSSFSKVNAAIKMPKLKILQFRDVPKISSLCLPSMTTNSNHCPVIQSCFNKVTFSVLGKLQLTRLPELIGRPLWKYEYDHHQQQEEVPTPIRSGWLKNLTSLKLQECDKLGSVFSELVARYLVQLEKLLIFKCKKLEAIVVPDDDVGMYKVEKATMEKEEIIFPKLQDLVLQGLPCFMGFDKVRTAIEMPQLKKLELFDLPEITSLCPPPPLPLMTPVTQSCFNKVVFAILEELQLKKLPKLIGRPLWKYEHDHHQQQEGPTHIRIGWLNNLTSLRLEECDILGSVFSAPVARDLMQLETIFISQCKTIEAIVIPNEGEDIYKAKEATTKEKEVIFPKLQKLVLQGLPCFASFYEVKTTIEMPQLQKLELSDLPRITSLCLPSIPPTTTNSNYDPVFQSCFNKVTLTSIEKLEFSLMDNLMEIWPRELQVPLKLRKLRVHYCPQLLNGDLLPLNWMQCGMKDLEDVYVKECQSVEVAFNLEGLTTTVKEFGIANQLAALPMLVNLNLLHLPRLTHVWKINATSPCSFQGFQKLRSIKIKGCSSLRYLFPTCVAKLLQSLEELEILECEAMEAIFAIEDPKLDDCDNEGTSSLSMLILLPQLEVLGLSHLPNLRSLCPQGFTFPGPLLDELTVGYCPHIEQHCWGNVDEVEIIPEPTDTRLFDGKVILLNQDGGAILVRGMDEPTNTWYKKVEEEVQGHLGETKKISFVSCGELLSVASANLMERMPNLRCLETWDCNSMEAIFDLIGFDFKEQSVSQLEELILEYLPKLTHVWKNTAQQSNSYFRGLRSLKVKNCNSLRYIFTISMAKALVHLKKLIIARCEKVEKIVTWDKGGKGEKEEEEEEETRKLFASCCLIKVKNLPNLICIGPEEDDSQFLTTKNLDVQVIFCRKYKDFRSG